MRYRLSLSKRLLLSAALLTMLGLIAGAVNARPAQAAPHPPAPPRTGSSAVSHTEARYEPTKSSSVGISSASLNYRHSWGAHNGECTFRLTNMPVSNGQTVLVTVTEGTADNVSIGGRVGLEFVGAAKITLNNVAVEDGAVEIWVTINWGSPLYLYAHYVIP
jgi:hypothetical protein